MIRELRASPVLGARWTWMTSFQTTRTPNPEQFYTYSTVTKQYEAHICTCCSNAFKFRCRWFGNCSFWMHPNLKEVA